MPKKKTAAKSDSINSRLLRIQKELKAPKNQFNSFGKYKYRNCEDILEAVKPILEDCVVLLNDSVEKIGGRYYVKATATLTDGKDKISNSAYAREPKSKKGMDASQVTGAASSYARKYALNGLFAIDDTKDADNEKNTGESVSGGVKHKKSSSTTKKASEKQLKAIFAISKVKGKTPKQIDNYIKRKYNLDSKKDLNSLQASKLIDILNKLPDEEPEEEEYDVDEIDNFEA